MCIIAVVPSAKVITKETLKRCWDNNPHGGGFTYTDGKKVKVYKEMSDFKAYYEAFLEVRELFPQSTIICHFRISTHGEINEANCHPFKVNESLSFCHNGVIRNSTYSDLWSDTAMFNKEILQLLPKDFLSSPAIVSLVKEYIGMGSKLAFLSWDNKTTIVNEEAGKWDNGVWFSNSGYKEASYYDAGGVRMSGNSGTYYGGYKGSGLWSGAEVNTKKSKAEKKAKAVSINDRIGSKGKPTSPEQVSLIDYNSKCVFCSSDLRGYYEKANLCCNSCSDKYENEWAL